MDNLGTKQTKLPDEPTDVTEARRVSTESTGTPEVKRQSKRKRKATKKTRKSVASQSKANGVTAILSVTPGIYILPAPSGAKYVWSGPGAQVLVANEDVDFVMAKNGGGTRECCGAGNSRIYFKLLEE